MAFRCWISSQVAHGLLGTAFTSDVGFIGLLAETGLFSLVFFVIPIIRMIYVLVKTKEMPLDANEDVFDGINCIPADNLGYNNYY